MRYRAHLDLATTSAAHQAELVAQLLELGATPADVGMQDVPWTVLADPEGDLFRVLEPRSNYRDTVSIAAVVVSCVDLKPYPGDDQAAEVARLRALGATDADVGQGDVP